MFTALGQQPLDFLREAGVYAPKGGGEDKFEIKLDSNEERAAAILRTVSSKYGLNFGATMPLSMQYVVLREAFVKKCLAREDSSAGIEVSVVAADGTINKVKYTLNGGANDVVEVGYSLSEDGGNDQKMACTTIVSQMNKFAINYSNVVKENAADENPNNDSTASDGAWGTSGTSDSNPTCETSGNPATWILCPIFNGVAGLSDWMFRNLVEPLLRTPPISTDPANGSFQVWNNFRLYGNILLVIFMLVIVFGQAIGGGIIEAYTAKKVMPRIFVAAIMVNISVYLVAILVDITNVIGGGIGQLITAPYADASQFSFSLDPSQSILIGGGTIVGLLGGVIFGALAGIGSAAAFLGLFVLLPAVIGIIGAFVTMVIRQGLILLLIIVSPVAFALYCLPSTEKYFKKWWELLTKALLVYPIVIVIFAVADIMAVTIQAANGLGDGPLLAQAPVVVQTPAKAIAALIAFVAMFLPMMMIPWAFKMAGGLIGSVVATLSKFGNQGIQAIKGNANDPNSLQNSTRRRVTGNVVKGRAEFVRHHFRWF
jgi:hypothetical protein